MWSRPLARAPWQVASPIQPIMGESLDGFVARAAAANWIDNNLELTSLAGVEYGHKPTLTTHGWEGLPILADCLQVSVEDLEKRSYPVDEAGRRSFFGVPVERHDLETRKRSFAPAGFRLSRHHRALWQLRPFPFCSETWQYLLDRCHRCGGIQRWYHANGVDRCDWCVEDLSRGEAVEVPNEQRPPLAMAVGLVHPDEATRLKSILALPSPLNTLEAGEAYELLVRLAAVADPDLTKSRKGAISSWSSTPAQISSAIAAAWTLLEGWPHSLSKMIDDRLAQAASRHSDGNGGASVRFLKGDRRLTPRVASIIASFRQERDLTGPDGPHLLAETMHIKEVAATLSKGTREIAEIRRAGGLSTVFTMNSKLPVARFNRAEVTMLARSMPQRVPTDSLAWAFGISFHGVLQMFEMKIISTEHDRYHIARYGCRQAVHAAKAEFERRLAASASKDQLSDPVSLAEAAKVIGGRHKPWGPIFGALFDQVIPFGLSAEDVKLSSRIKVERSSAPVIMELTFPGDLLDGTAAVEMSRRDACEVLNLTSRYSDLFATLSPRPSKHVAADEVLELARRHISSSEIGMRLGIPASSASARARRKNIPLLGPAGWCRVSAEKQLLS